MSGGFRFEPAANSIPSSVFFPQSDPGERLTQCSASLQALLGENGGDAPGNGWYGNELRYDGEIWNMDTETWEEADIHLNIGKGGFSLVTMSQEIDCN